MALLPTNRVVVTADVNGNLPQAVLNKLPAGGSSGATATYASGVWPARPAGATGSVTWVSSDPAAPYPTAALAGDVVILSSTTQAGSSTDILTPDQSNLKADWAVSVNKGGSVDLTAGTATVAATSDQVHLRNLPVVGGAKYTVTVVPKAGSTGKFMVLMHLVSPTATVYGYIGDPYDPVNAGAATTAFTQSLTETAPADATELNLYIEGTGNGTAVIDKVFLTRWV